MYLSQGNVVEKTELPVMGSWECDCVKQNLKGPSFLSLSFILLAPSFLSLSFIPLADLKLTTAMETF